MNRNLVLVAVSLFTWGVGEGLFIYFQPLYLQEWGADPLMIGAVFGAMGIAMAVSQIPAGYLADRLGARSLMIASWLLGTTAAWVMALAGSLPIFVVGLVLYGLTSFVLAPMNSYITNVRGNLSVGRALSFCSGLYNLGAVLGPISGGLIADRLGLKPVYMVGAVFFVISTSIVLFTAKKPETHHADLESTNSMGILRNTRFMAFLALTLVTCFVLYLPQTFTPSFLQNQHNMSRTTIGILGAIGSLGNAVATLALGNLNAVVGLLVGQVWLLVFAVIYYTADLPAWFGIGYFFIGGYRLMRAMVLAIGRTLVHPQQTGLAYGMVETMNAVAVIFAPVLAGAIYRVDPYRVYSVSIVGILVVLIANLIIFGILRRRNNHESQT